MVPLEIRRRPRNRARLRRSARDVLQPTVFFLLLLVVWELAVRVFRIPVYLLPAPSVIWTDTTRIAAAVGGHTLATLQTIVIGFLVSIAVSLPLQGKATLIPEPATFVLLSLGLLALGAAQRKRRGLQVPSASPRISFPR